MTTDKVRVRCTICGEKRTNVSNPKTARKAIKRTCHKRAERDGFIAGYCQFVTEKD